MSERCLYVGIDEAGYGPNLGPLVMTAVAAEGPADRPPNVWRDLRTTVARVGGPAKRLWIDDSKRILSASDGRQRLEATVLATVGGLGGSTVHPTDLASLTSWLGAGDSTQIELDAWCDGSPVALPLMQSKSAAEVPGRKIGCPHWELREIRTVVVGPARFNSDLAEATSKAAVHFQAFRQLVDAFWTRGNYEFIRIKGDKHGGRHYYMEPLQTAWPDTWIERGPEGPNLSRYVFHGQRRRLELQLEPRGDQYDGLVALASMVSKYVRECWMSAFNEFWCRRMPALRPTAGYPNDATRFRREIAGLAAEARLCESTWWRAR